MAKSAPVIKGVFEGHNVSGIHGSGRSAEEHIIHEEALAQKPVNTENLPWCDFGELPTGKVCNARIQEGVIFLCKAYKERCPYA